MKVLFIILLFFICTHIKAQLEVPSNELIQKFFKTTTCIVLEENPFSESNIQLKSAAEKFWKLTPFEIIGVEEFEKRRKSEHYSFLSVDEVYFDNSKNPIRYKFLCLYLGGNYKTESDMPQLCTVPLSYIEEDESNYSYKIGTLLIFIQQHIQNILNNPELKKSNIIEFYNKNIGSLKNKTLFLIKNEVESKLQNESYIKKIYPYEVKLVTQDEIEDAIDNREPNVVFLHKVGINKADTRTYKILIGTNDAKIYYFDYHIVNNDKPNAFLESDLKNLIK